MNEHRMKKKIRKELKMEIQSGLDYLPCTEIFLKVVSKEI